uniref:Uncharacterized protein n=1 Tax=Bionectria ochroleuca TaxID=29856 RepID=A0A0B7JNN5_BIOOC
MGGPLTLLDLIPRPLYGCSLCARSGLAACLYKLDGDDIRVVSQVVSMRLLAEQAPCEGMYWYVRHYQSTESLRLLLVVRLGKLSKSAPQAIAGSSLLLRNITGRRCTLPSSSLFS